mgnify:CR=1 FL=1
MCLQMQARFLVNLYFLWFTNEKSKDILERSIGVVYPHLYRKTEVCL